MKNDARKIKIDNYGCCLEADCPYRRKCAQHASAGDFRTEDGFRPEIWVKKNSECYCKTMVTPPKEKYGHDSEIPHNENELGSGFIPIGEIPEYPIYLEKDLGKKQIVNPDASIEDIFSELESPNVIIQNKNYEPLQEFIVSIGGRFFRKSELESMTIGELFEMVTPNVKQKTNIIFVIDNDKKSSKV